MESILYYFETIPSSHRSIILIGGIAFFWCIEYATPLFGFSYKKFKHAIPNIFFTVTTIIINFVLAFILFQTSDWTIANSFGVLQWLSLPLWATILLGVALLDLIGAWLAHYAQHKIKRLWMFHLIHHTDNYVDTTTANRHHPGESFIRFIFTTLAVFIVGTPIDIIMLYQSLSVILSQFNHANISLPKQVDRVISWIIVSPDMHKVHHHHMLPYTDTNYGNIFSIWDRIFRTYSKLPNQDLVYGVDTYPEVNSNTTILKLLKLPFTKYRLPINTKVNSKFF
ncbi:sterol desaturase family protein [Aquimarina muelleri]|uniref:Sterol desaturase n=1 Tax=Aquimarina muelleri TaxID=279356 RepID=A0A918JS36_9FLAO|nr:sterol desaturase family protein [Aquimarina muelleri]MCX2763468.1 sterol desaturase family protein [Aquimarina muelleri]GGX02487.1 sterol desaturase [Aquimarina muelleri]